MVRISVKGWEDGKRYDREIDALDRWLVHSAEEVVYHFDDQTVTLKQKPHAITGKKIGVGACTWDGAFVLSYYLAKLPRHKFIGTKVVELGAGTGLVGLACARFGANVILTDIAKVVPLLAENVEANGVAPYGSHPSGTAGVEELQWGTSEAEAMVKRLNDPAADVVLAADCVYVDSDGLNPDIPAFLHHAAGLMGRESRFLVCFEVRTSDVRTIFLQEAGKIFSKAEKKSLKSLPEGLQADHIELYEFSL